MNINTLVVKNLKILVTITLSLFINVAANAGVIVDTDNDSFIDTSTGIEWLDFGVNNGQSFNDVVSQLGTGGRYAGWVLPTLNQVHTMWSNVANLNNVTALSESPNHYGEGQFRAFDLNSNTFNGDDSVWDLTFDVIGYNGKSINDSRIHTYSKALFEGTDGLSIVNMWDITDLKFDNVTYADGIEFIDNANYNQYESTTFTNYSTLLIKATEVPEPPAFALFATAFSIFVMRKRKLKVNTTLTM